MNGNGGRLHLIDQTALRVDRIVQRLDPGAPPIGGPMIGSPRELEAAPADAAPRRRSFEAGRPIIDSTALGRAGMIDWHRSGSRVAEEFRIALTEISRQIRGADRPAAGSRLIMITSALAGEGKSFTAINLAVGIARQGEHRVLLVDGDGRQGCAGDLFGVPAATGAAGALSGGEFDMAEMSTRTCVENLDFLRLGSRAEGSDEASVGALAVIEAIAQHCQDRVVLIDTPPCLSSSRPHLLAPLVAQAVLVVAAGRTQRGDVEAALGMIRTCPSISLLLNRVSRWQGHSFGSDGITG
jgi:receptor protein-tyrosine kinase